MCFIANVFQDIVIFVGQLTMYIIRKKCLDSFHESSKRCKFRIYAVYHVIDKNLLI